MDDKTMDNIFVNASAENSKDLYTLSVYNRGEKYQQAKRLSESLSKWITPYE